MKRNLWDYPNVVGFGYGLPRRDGIRRLDEGRSRIVLVERKLPLRTLAAADVVPKIWQGEFTDVIEVGHLRALEDDRRARWRPAPGGVSIGHRDITAGTLGIVVHDRAGRPVILSNNHVLANSNRGTVGDPILQPGPADGGQESRDTIAQLEGFVPIMFSENPPSCPIAQGAAAAANALAQLSGSDHRLKAVRESQEANRVDAAIARPLRDDLVSLDVLEEVRPAEVATVHLSTGLQKSGRTTGWTTGEVLAIDVMVDVDYGGPTARFGGQILAGPMSAGGDSGSAVLDDHGRLVGLLFAGSDQATIINQIQDVFELLALQL